MWTKGIGSTVGAARHARHEGSSAHSLYARLVLQYSPHDERHTSAMCMMVSLSLATGLGGGEAGTLCDGVARPACTCH